MNLIKEIEQILQQPIFIGNDKTGCNLAANAILDKFDELGLEIVKKENIKADEILREQLQLHKFNIGDEVYFHDCQMFGEIESINDDGTYDIIWNSGNGGGRFTVSENDMVLM